MPEGNSIKFIHFMVEMDNDDRYVMHLDGEQCQEVVGIAWGTLAATDEHPWASLYRGLAAINSSRADEFIDAAAEIKRMGAVPIPKVRFCKPKPPTDPLCKLPRR